MDSIDRCRQTMYRRKWLAKTRIKTLRSKQATLRRQTCTKCCETPDVGVAPDGLDRADVISAPTDSKTQPQTPCDKKNAQCAEYIWKIDRMV